MMKRLLTVILLCGHCYLQAQPLLKISYKIGNQRLSDFTYVFLSDSVMQFNYVQSGLVSNQAERMQDKKLSHHTSFANKDSGAVWHVGVYPPSIKALTRSLIDTTAYILKPNIKHILGYKCMLASVTDTKGDEFLVWYTDSIKGYYSKCYAYGAPGVVLQMQHKFKDGRVYYYTATDISYTDGNIIFPDDVAVVDQDNWPKIRTHQVKVSDYNLNPKATNKKDMGKYPENFN